MANRIANGAFSIQGQTFSLAINNGPNTLHGGICGFDKLIWEAVEENEGGKVGVRFSLNSPDGDEGFPGNVSVQLLIELDDQNQLSFKYTANTDRATPINLTNHTYWNLSGNLKSPISTQHIQLNCDHFTPVDSVQIPTGEIASVQGTGFDLRALQQLGPAIAQVDGGGQPGFDHNFVVRPQDGVAPVGELRDEASGRRMEIFSDQPGVQVYTGNFLSTDASKHPHIQHNAICFEAQNFPDAVNKPNFPKSVLLPGETYTHHTVYRFSVA